MTQHRRYQLLRARLNTPDADPIVVVPVHTQEEAQAVRQGGGLAVPPPQANPTPTVENVISFDPDITAPAPLRALHPDAFLLDMGAPRNRARAIELRNQGVDAISVGTFGYGIAGTPVDRETAYAIANGDEPSVPLIGRGLNAVRALGVFENLGTAAIILVVRRGVTGHKDGIAAGVSSLLQAAACRREGGNVFSFAQRNPEFSRAFDSFTSDADALYPGWREQQGCPS